MIALAITAWLIIGAITAIAFAAYDDLDPKDLFDIFTAIMMMIGWPLVISTAIVFSIGLLLVQAGHWIGHRS